jgi:hypothetical protein
MRARVRAVVVETLALFQWVVKMEGRCSWMISRDVCRKSSEKEWRQHKESRLVAGGFAVVVGMHGCLAGVIRHSRRLGTRCCYERRMRVKTQERTCASCGPVPSVLLFMKQEI